MFMDVHEHETKRERMCNVDISSLHSHPLISLPSFVFSPTFLFFLQSAVSRWLSPKSDCVKRADIDIDINKHVLVFISTLPLWTSGSAVHTPPLDHSSSLFLLYSVTSPLDKRRIYDSTRLHPSTHWIHLPTQTRSVPFFWSLIWHSFSPLLPPLHTHTHPQSACKHV